MSLIFCNRTLNMKKISHIGLDMDHTLIQYHSEVFEALAYESMKKKLVENYSYPASVLSLKFDYNRSIRGLVIDKNSGNLLKVSRFGMVREAYHGLERVDFKDQKKKFGTKFIDLRDENYDCIDTTFSISHACLYSQVIDLKKSGKIHYDFPDIAEHLGVALDESHRDGSIKDEVIRNPEKYIKKSEEVVRGIQKFKKHGKVFFLATNSDYAYTNAVLKFAIDPFLDGETWQDLFKYTFTLCMKPRFFYSSSPLLKINRESGLMTNWDKKIEPGIYQGGSSDLLSDDLKLLGDNILYVGDHIYGDIVKLKKACGWRTALVVEELEREIEQNQKALVYTNEVKILMEEKRKLELYLNGLVGKRYELDEGDKEQEKKVLSQIAKLDEKLGPILEKRSALYNKYWGPVMRTGVEESQFAIQVEGFSDIYMPSLKDLLSASPRNYFRSYIRQMAHD